MAFEDSEKVKGIICFCCHIIIGKKEVFSLLPNDRGKFLIDLFKRAETITLSIDRRDRAEFTPIWATSGRFDRFEKGTIMFVKKVPPGKGHPF
jgi:hypothetical protein